MNTQIDPNIASLLKSGLAALLPVVVYGFQLVYLAFLRSTRFATVDKLWFIGAMALVAFGIGFANDSIDKAPPTVVTDFWFVQGGVFFVGMLALEMVNQKLYGSTDTVKTVTVTQPADVATRTVIDTPAKEDNK